MPIIYILLSGICYYFGNGLSGDYWFLLWVAPVPVIYLALKSSRQLAFWAAFFAYLIGRLSWLGYLITVATLVPAIIVILITALIFGGIILLTRSVALRVQSWYALFAFPVFFTAFEYLMMWLSRDGSAASIAYSQMNCVPLIQVAAVGGVLGVTFMVTLIPAAIFFKNKVVMGLIAMVLVWGYFRPGKNMGGGIKVGLVVMKEGVHDYVAQIDSLARQGVSVVLLPERAVEDNLQPLQKAAYRQHIYLIAGYTGYAHNSAWVIDNQGKVLADYQKKYLVTGFERQFTPGNRIGLFKIDSLQAGVAICKDLDFQRYIRKYGKQRPAVLFIPAWDFVVDDWLHARMAILRGVENGFAEVRAARTGLLTISDCYGRVLSEASSVDEQTVSLVGEVPLHRVDTFYTKLGDWIGVVCLILSGLYLLFFRRLKVSGDMPK